MATFRHPTKGVILNCIDMHRKALEPDDIVTAKSLRQSGHTVHEISAMLGTNPGRVSEAIGKRRSKDPRQLTLL